MPADLIAAVIYAESRFRDQTSHAGARGLMQITPSTAKVIERLSGGQTFKFEDLSDPDINIRYGTFYLRYLLEKFDDNEIAALAAYNAGETNVAAWGGSSLGLDDIPFPRDPRIRGECARQARRVRAPLPSRARTRLSRGQRRGRPMELSRRNRSLIAALACASALGGLAAPSAAAAAAPRARASIVGGGRADPAQWPFAVAIFRKGHMHCSGSVIAPTKVLTAGHCVAGFNLANFQVIIGRPTCATPAVGQSDRRQLRAGPSRLRADRACTTWRCSISPSRRA